MKNVRLVVTLMLGLGIITMCGANGPDSKSFPKAALEASLSGNKKKPVLTVQLANTGDVPIVVDKELVCLLNISPLNKEYRDTLEEIRKLRKPVVSVLKSRLITLKPGEKIERQIDLRKGFKLFASTGIGFSVDGNVAGKITAYEAIYRMLADAQPDEIWISYELESIFKAPFKAYMRGVDIDQFYRGPLKVIVPYKFTEDTNSGPTERQETTQDVSK